MLNQYNADVVIIGAGPAGCTAAALLLKKGLKSIILERETFPRFSIGESLLPQCMTFLEEAGLLPAVVAAGFQHKDGAVFERGPQRKIIDFGDKVSDGWSTTYQVPRARFDKVLADATEAMGVDIRYGHETLAVDVSGDRPAVTVRGPDGVIVVTGRFLLDASGFGRVLPRLLALEAPSGLPPRLAWFTHVEDHITTNDFDRNKILITIHPDKVDVWLWLIPFSNGRCSVGVVAEPHLLAHLAGSETDRLRAVIAETPTLARHLGDAVWDTPARQLTGYSANVRCLHGRNYALLGNAGEFLDPVFSSGVTIALKSASLAAPLVARQLAGGQVHWPAEYDAELRKGVEAFRAFVESWYAGGFQNVIFFPTPQAKALAMVVGILAGYAWDANNRLAAQPHRLRALELHCARA